MILLLLNGKINAQNIESFKLRDTIYIYFDVNQKYDDLHQKNNKKKFNESYEYVFPDGKNITFSTLQKKYLEIYKKEKTFIIDKYSTILRLNEFKYWGYEKILKLFYDKKFIIYLIDKKDFTKRKILIKRVFLQNLQEIII